MSIRCPGCGRTIAVPPERAANPALKVKCTCGLVFACAEATIAAAGPAGTRPAPPAAAAPARHQASTSRPAGAAVVAAGASVAPPSQPTTTGLASPPVEPARRRPPGGWRRCVQHPQTASRSVCAACLVGYCDQCEKKVQNASICPTCDGLCVSTADYEQMQVQDRQRSRPLKSELPAILSYPLRDPIAYVMLSIFTWFFGLFAKFSGLGVLLSQGVLMWYSFHALSKVAVGNFRDFMPDFRDITDLVNPMRLGAAAFVISAGPLIALSILLPGVALMAGAPDGPELGVVHAQAPPEDEAASEEEGDDDAYASEESAGILGDGTRPVAYTLLLVFALVWKVVYTPVALTVAGLSRSMLSTLNPVIGIGTIGRMGSVYWQALAIYTVLAGAQWLIGYPLGMVPILGSLVKSFVDSYAYLAIGCTLGFAVFKKAKELGWD